MSPPDAGCRARVYIPAPTCCSLLDASLFPPSTHPTGNSQFHSLKRTISYRQRRQQQKNSVEETSAMCHMCHLRSLLYPPPLAAGWRGHVVSCCESHQVHPCLNYRRCLSVFNRGSAASSLCPPLKLEPPTTKTRRERRENADFML